MVLETEDFPSLIAQTGPLNGQRWIINGNVIVGRDETCNVVIQNRQVSRYHARFVNLPQGVQLEDLGSKNGTHINGKEVVEPVILQDGDVIQIAYAQQFIYLSSDSTLPLESPSEMSAGTAPSSRLLRLEKRSRRVWIGDAELLPPLSVSQYQLMELLYDNPGRVVARSELIQAVWGQEDAVGVSEQALDALIRRLRDRLAEINPKHPFLVTVRGHGLRLDNPPYN
ncbi:MAG TPA: FHA domain-containing protein [Anaerolineales bacterium]|nr:FHA domain-containing protein [Anaerolineales bacterium]